MTSDVGTLILCVCLGVLLGIGVLLFPLLNTRSKLNTEKSRTKELEKSKDFYENKWIEANAQATHNGWSAETLHAKIGCKNDDKWSDHTPKTPDGLTVEEVAKRESLLTPEEKDERDAVNKYNDFIHSIVAKMEGKKGYKSHDGTWIPLVSDVKQGFFGGGSGSSGGSFHSSGSSDSSSHDHSGGFHSDHHHND